MKQWIVLALIAGALFVLGCDFNPTGPFEGFEGGDGATLTGVFQNDGVALAPVNLRGPGGPGFASLSLGSTEGYQVGVIVDGEEIGLVDIEGGTFTLRGLPNAFSLQFYDADGHPVGDPVEFTGVLPNQQIEIVVRLDESGDVELVEERRTGIGNRGEAIEIEGRVEEVIEVTSNDGMTGSLTVDDYTVNTRSGETSIRKGNRSLTLDDLDGGDRVHVRGMVEGVKEVFAWEIKLQEDEEEDGSPEACTYEDPAKSNHILVCHKGRTLSIAPEAWPGHAGHGDTCGPCGSN